MAKKPSRWPAIICKIYLKQLIKCILKDCCASRGKPTTFLKSLRMICLHSKSNFPLDLSLPTFAKSLYNRATLSFELHCSKSLDFIPLELLMGIRAGGRTAKKDSKKDWMTVEEIFFS